MERLKGDLLVLPPQLVSVFRLCEDSVFLRSVTEQAEAAAPLYTERARLECRPGHRLFSLRYCTDVEKSPLFSPSMSAS